MLEYTYDASGNVTSQTAGNVLLPRITGQPVKQIVAPGEIVTLSVVVADARAVKFQWKFNGADIPGATGDSLLLTNVSDANEGQYSVVLTNSAGSVTSAPVALLLDSDRDGLPNTWEQANFTDPDPTHPLHPANQRSETDPDEDGISNLDEFLDSTNPASAASLKPRLVAYGDAGGSVTVTPMKLSHEPGETVALMAVPFAPSVFASWDGDLNGAVNPATLTMDTNKTVRARFASAVTLPPGLIAIWRGETDASDLIGGHDGTFFSGATVTAPSVTALGKVGGAFSFDGTVHIQVPGAAALKPAQITLEAWVFPTSLLAGHQTVIACGSSTNADDTWCLSYFYGTPMFLSHGFRLITGPSVIPLNEWTHLAATFDGATKRLYVNGAEVAQQGGLDALVYDPAPVPVTIGADWISNAPGDLFNGRIDEVAIYNRALTLNEVADSFNAGFVGKNLGQPYIISPSQLPNVVLDASYTQQFETVLGTAPVGFSLSAGALPPGLDLSSTGLLRGAPGVSGIFDFTVQATDSAGQSTEQLCILRVLQPVVRPAGLVAWWRGEPAAGGVVSDQIGGHDGGFFSGSVAVPPAYTADGKVGSAFTFDGTLHVQIPDTVELRPPEMTVEGWIFPALLKPDLNMVIARGFAGYWNAAWYLCLYFANGRPRFMSNHLSAAGLVVTDGLEGPSAVPLNKWTHIAATFDGEIKRLYVNGAEVAWKGGLGALNYTIHNAALLPVTIGAAWVSSAPEAHFNGRIDEMSLYRRALSAAEIFSLADAGPAGKGTAGL